MEGYITAVEACARLGVDRKTLEARVKSGYVQTCIGAGRYKLYREVDIAYVAGFDTLESTARAILGFSKPHFLAWSDETDLLPALVAAYRRVYYRRTDVHDLRDLLSEYVTPMDAERKYGIDARQLRLAADAEAIESLTVGSFTYLLRQDIEALYPPGEQYSVGQAARLLGTTPGRLKRLCRRNVI